nr:MAG TPA: hypothetical protein [Caudoviricetes sp.]
MLLLLRCFLCSFPLQIRNTYLHLQNRKRRRCLVFQHLSRSGNVITSEHVAKIEQLSIVSKKRDRKMSYCVLF